MEFFNFNRIFRNWNHKYTFHHKLSQTKFVNLIKTNNVANLCFFRILHIIVKKLNFGFSIAFFKIKMKNIHLIKKVQRFKVDPNHHFASPKLYLFLSPHLCKVTGNIYLFLSVSLSADSLYPSVSILTTKWRVQF